MRDHHLTACPHWCDRAHSDYSTREQHPNGDVTHWHAIHADHDPALELARVTLRKTWTSNGFTSVNPGRLKLRLAPFWADADLNSPDGDLLATTIARGRDLIARLDDEHGGRW